MSNWRYIAQRALTGEFLDLDVPMFRDELTWALSGPGSLRGTVTPDVGNMRAADGKPVFDEWGTLLYAESDGQIRWGGIVVRSEFAGPNWSIEAAGMTTYPHGIPYLGSYSRIGVDPLDVVREIWRHVQSDPAGNLGMVIDSDTSPIRLGVGPLPAFQEAQIDGQWVPSSTLAPGTIVPTQTAPLKVAIDNNDTSLTLKTMGGFDSLTPPYNVKIGSETLTVNGRSGLVLTGLVRGVGTSTGTGHNAGTAVTHAGTPVRTHPVTDAQPYALDWWDARDCGGEIDTLSQEAPFDFAEAHSWAADNTITHRLQIGYPRLGTRRTDLAFVQGDNVANVVTVTRDGGNFANDVLGLGAGEGSETIHAGVREMDGRLRRMFVYSDKSAKTPARITALARREMTARLNVLEFSSVEVIDHPNARIGSWQLGDDVLIQADIPWLGQVAIWERVVGWSLTAENRATLQLVRSDSFTYGGTTL